MCHNTFVRFLLNLVINAVALWATATFLPGMNITAELPDVSPNFAHALGVLVLALIFGLVNGLIRPIISTLSIPITCLTLGLFTLVINAVMVLITAKISEFTFVHLSVDNFLIALIAGVIIGLVSSVVNWVIHLMLPAR